MTDSLDLYASATAFTQWLDERITQAGRGDLFSALDVEPSGSFWLGRLAPEESVIELGLGERGERLDPCAVGIRIRPSEEPVWEFRVHVHACAWLRDEERSWRKTEPVDEWIPVQVAGDVTAGSFGGAQLASALTQVSGVPGLQAEIRVELEEHYADGAVLTVLLVNTSPKEHDDFRDTNLYETVLEVADLASQPFSLTALPDSFRYDRRVPAYGVNCGVQIAGDTLRTTDTVVVERARPDYWSGDRPQPDLSFRTLAEDPLPSLMELMTAASEWGDRYWSEAALDAQAETDVWTTAMASEARLARSEFETELERMANGLRDLESNPVLLQAFQLMNDAISHSSRGRYAEWRPFQVGFLLANLDALTEPEAAATTVDIVWFATGGGKTETYLGLLVMAALYDRMSGKSCGISAWSRFPLRMLSLQQTQRFADALAGAELARRRADIPGEPFAVGFLVGQAATPNRIPLEPKEWEADPDDPEMPAQYKVLLYCPFCGTPDLEMKFLRRYWQLAHCCPNETCPWSDEALPFFIVDEELYRFLPTVVVGTLDKAASLGLQAAMRGLVGAPLGVCSADGHGFVYAPRSTRPSGCLVPGCRGTVGGLPMEGGRFGPRFRLQDELHLLRDSLGAVDAHYESLADYLAQRLGGTKPKVLASSATLAGYARQVDVLYRREARVFPVQGPSSETSLWTRDTERLARRFVAVAPRGVTMEFATDRLLTELQNAVRALAADPRGVCAEIGIPAGHAEQLVSLYGVDICYGNTLRDLDAVSRSLESQQVPVEPLAFESLTGRTPFEEVRGILSRLETPEAEFNERLHIITASSMMSHGVDIDRLNVMVMLGLPLTTAEFIQTTARVGRRWPGLVVVLHKIARERDASVYRFFPQFVTHGDRFVEPVPITRRSRRVLDRTIAGLQLARILHVHEPASATSLTTVSRLRTYFRDARIGEPEELEALIELLDLNDPLDELLREDLRLWVSRFVRNLEDPAGTFIQPKELSPSGDAMISLRDVEELAPVRESTR